MPRSSRGIRITVSMLLLGLMMMLVPHAAAQEEPLTPAHEQLQPPVKAVDFAHVFIPYQLMPRWSQGHLISWKRENGPTDTEEDVSVYDRTGQLAGKIRIAVPNSHLMYLDNVVAGPDGRIAAVGSTVNSSGEFDSFVADVNLAAKTVKIVMLEPFRAHDVTFGADGTLWIAGYYSEFGNRLSTKDYVVVKHLGADGRLQDSKLMQSSLGCKWYSFSAAEGVLFATKDRIGLILQNCQQWVELNTDGEVVGRWRWKKSDEVDFVANATLTPSDELYAHIQGSQDLRCWWWLGHLNKKTGEWEEVNVDPLAAQLGLRGSEEDMLVLSSGEGELKWARVSTQ